MKSVKKGRGRVLGLVRGLSERVRESERDGKREREGG